MEIKDLPDLLITMSVDDLALQGARIWAAMILTQVTCSNLGPAWLGAL